ncbi:MBL fold metallo-hydrolase [Salibacterium salarium]|uniref:MBL fold metallo-hydrolase n=1 Tax=Salibacterium salarium TaxID=284579 RepID=A0A3R9P4H9_9BACI|nr:MBL fold metallo-hydrolase [Salibacterium salarium]RSL32648.1 MBL fold metallo-hydrolase [Salibacterium salarium]
MKVNILASGSGGNCIAVRTDNTTIVIDAGVAKTKIEKKMLEVGIRADDIKAFFVTHAHKDHTKGLPLANKYHIPVHAAANEWKDIQGVDGDLQNTISSEGILFDYEGYNEWIEIIPFSVSHDAYDPKGYIIQTNGKKLSICLDTGTVSEDMLAAMSGSDIYVIEANHDVDMLTNSAYPLSVQVRIASHIGHLSNEQTADALAKLVKGQGERIYLTHLSSSNNMPALAKMAAEQELKKKGYLRGKHYELEVVK